MNAEEMREAIAVYVEGLHWHRLSAKEAAILIRSFVPSSKGGEVHPAAPGHDKATPAPDALGERAIFSPGADHPQGLPFADVRAEAADESVGGQVSASPTVGALHLPQIDGLETTAEERDRWINQDARPTGVWHMLARAARDHARLIALLAEALARTAGTTGTISTQARSLPVPDGGSPNV